MANLPKPVSAEPAPAAVFNVASFPAAKNGEQGGLVEIRIQPDGDIRHFTGLMFIDPVSMEHGHLIDHAMIMRLTGVTRGNNAVGLARMTLVAPNDSSGRMGAMVRAPSGFTSAFIMKLSGDQLHFRSDELGSFILSRVSSDEASLDRDLFQGWVDTERVSLSRQRDRTNRKSIRRSIEGMAAFVRNATPTTHDLIDIGRSSVRIKNDVLTERDPGRYRSQMSCRSMQRLYIRLDRVRFTFDHQLGRFSMPDGSVSTEDVLRFCNSASGDHLCQGVDRLASRYTSLRHRIKAGIKQTAGELDRNQAAITQYCP